MKRPIKFRVWVEEDNTMQFPSVFSTGIEGNDFLPLIKCSDGNMAYTHHKCMQYTGWKDINGKEIYEDDICKSRDIIFQVKWFSNACAFGAFDEDSVPLSWFINEPDIEVIGNIYQNTELFKY